MDKVGIEIVTSLKVYKFSRVFLSSYIGSQQFLNEDILGFNLVVD